MTVILEGSNKFLVGAPARIVEEDRELAWAEKHVYKNPAYKWLLGRFVAADEPNDNGHIFPLKELETAGQSLLHAPLNMLHMQDAIMGTYVGNEMVYPLGMGESAGEVLPPYMEALAVMYKYYFPEAYDAVEKAHKEGALSFSMECIPEEIVCGHCEQAYKYAGRTSDTYCADLQVMGSRRQLIKPHFVGGAIIIPPSMPAWKQATVHELSSLISKYESEAASTYEQMKTDHPHLDSSEWEQMMALVLKHLDED